MINISENREKFIDLINSIELPYVRKEDLLSLVDYLDNSDFFYAPTTALYQGNYEGGLCEHSLFVYSMLVELNKITHSNYSDDTLKLVGLLHNLNKTNYYEGYNKNIKDELTGKWIQVPSFKIKDAFNRETFGDSGVNAMSIVSKFIPLRDEEMIALINQHCGMDNNYSNKDIYSIMQKYPLTVLLHTADLLVTYVYPTQPKQ